MIRRASHRGFTLMELMVSSAISALVLAAMGSTILLTTKALPTASDPLEARLYSARVLEQMAEEIETARFVTERTARAITIVVNDRAADGRNDTIRYAWSGTSGAPLTRTLNGGTAVEVLTDVRDFSVNYTYQTVTETYPAATGGGNYATTRYLLTTVRPSVRCGPESTARVETLIHALNLPECVTHAWEADFSSNPTRIDLMAHGAWDWVRRDGLAFTTAALSGGAWSVNTTLDTRPLCNFDTLTTVEVKMRNASVGGNGAVFWINADSTGGTFAPIIVYLRRQADGTQNLQLSKKTSNSTTVLMTQVTGLSSGYQKIRLLIDPSRDLVNLKVNDMECGTFQYATFTPTSADKWATLSTSASSTLVDFVSIRVWSAAP